MITPIFAGDSIKKEIILNVDDMYNLRSVFNNFDEEERIVFSSDNSEICYIYGSYAVAQNVGSSIITAENSKQNDACRVFVKEPTPTVFTSASLSYLYGFETNSKYIIDGEAYISDSLGKIELNENLVDKTLHIIKHNAEPKCNSDEFLLTVGHHHFYSKDEIIQPTCENGGYTKHICSCKQFITDNYKQALGHNITDFSYDETNHYKACNNIGCNYKENTEPHIFDNLCDSTCNICGYIRAVSHKFTDECHPICTVCGISGNDNHKYLYSCSNKCYVCGEERNALHIYDSDSDMTCNICGYIRKNKDEQNETGGENNKENNENPELSEHRFSKSFTKTKRYHTKKCLDCDYTVKDVHIYDSAYDDTCNICGYKRKLVNFPDVKNDNPYYESIRYVSSLGIFKGYESGYFGPDNSIQTQDLILALSRFDSVTLKDFNRSLSFKDAKKSHYYYNAIVWGFEKGIYKGISKTVFGVSKPLTYKETLTIIYRYLNTKGIYAKTNTGDESENAVLFFLQNGYITADDTALLNSYIQRQKTADIFYKIFINKIVLP